MDTNPGPSFTSTGILPIFSASSLISAAVSSDVISPRMTSTSFMIGTGFIKCIPMKCSGLFVAEAISVIGIVDVFDEKIVSFLHMPSSSLNNSFFTFTFSKIASITRSTSLKSSSFVVPFILERIFFFSSAVILPFSILLSRKRSILLIPFFTYSSLISLSITLKPAFADTRAMPCPI